MPAFDASPITPEQVREKKQSLIPPGVFTVVNRFIAENYDENSCSSTVLQRELVSAICNELGVTSDEIYNKRWLDIEGIYRKAGWKVRYDKPGYNEDYDPFFVFKE